MITVEGSTAQECMMQLARGRERTAWVSIDPQPQHARLDDEAYSNSCTLHYRVTFDNGSERFSKVLSPEKMIEFLKDEVKKRKSSERQARKLQLQTELRYAKGRLKQLEQNNSCCENEIAAAKAHIKQLLKRR